MADSNQLRARADQAVIEATGCSAQQAHLLVGAIATFIARFNAEIYAKEGPAWQWYEENCEDPA